MSLLVLQLDGAPAAHLRHALDAHGRWCRANGIAVPPELAELVEIAARSGPERTDMPDSDVLAHTLLVPLAHTYEESAALLSVSERTIRRLVKDGELCAMEIGGCRRIHRDDLADYATRRRLAAGAPA